MARYEKTLEISLNLQGAGGDEERDAAVEFVPVRVLFETQVVIEDGVVEMHTFKPDFDGLKRLDGSTETLSSGQIDLIREIVRKQMSALAPRIGRALHKGIIDDITSGGNDGPSLTELTTAPTTLDPAEDPDPARDRRAEILDPETITKLLTDAGVALIAWSLARQLLAAYVEYGPKFREHPSFATITEGTDPNFLNPVLRFVSVAERYCEVHLHTLTRELAVDQCASLAAQFITRIPGLAHTRERINEAATAVFDSHYIPLMVYGSSINTNMARDELGVELVTAVLNTNTDRLEMSRNKLSVLADTELFSMTNTILEFVLERVRAESGETYFDWVIERFDVDRMENRGDGDPPEGTILQRGVIEIWLDLNEPGGSGEKGFPVTVAIKHKTPFRTPKTQSALEAELRALLGNTLRTVSQLKPPRT